MQALTRAALLASAVLLAACGTDETLTMESVGSPSELLSPEVQAATHTCTTFIVGSLDYGSPCFSYVDAKNTAITHCSTEGLSLGYDSWNISSGSTCASGHVTYFRYGCCGVE